MDIKHAYGSVKSRMSTAAQQASRDDKSIKLLAVSKQQSAAAVAELVALGQRDIGENYWQEAQQKQSELAQLDICWHFIGRIQSNKAKSVANAFDWVHTVDSLRLAKKLSQHRAMALGPLNICLQVNIDAEDSKQGVMPELSAVMSMVEALRDLPQLALRGLMCIPAPVAGEAPVAAFARMQVIFDCIKRDYPQLPWDTLSMGMSADLEAAIAAGSTCIRVGSALFGARTI